tara:strand:+ start:121 stop:243 length:123 start_codon:yes stop_codon:yes gene_type:complete
MASHPDSALMQILAELLPLDNAILQGHDASSLIHAKGSSR